MENVTFLVPEKGGIIQLKVGNSFVVIATLATPSSAFSSSESDSFGKNDVGISLALRNRFVTIHVETPDLNFETRKNIARSVLLRMTDKKIGSALSIPIPEEVPSGRIPKKLCTTQIPHEDVDSISSSIGHANPLPGTVRDVAMLSIAVGWLHGVISLEKNEMDQLVLACLLNEDWLASSKSEILIDRTIMQQKIEGQRFFFNTSNRKSTMWQLIASLCTASASAQHLFLQVW
jgi:hypothetical protein